MEQFAEFVANHLFLFTLLVAILTLLLWNIFGNTLSGIEQLNAMEATRMINHQKGVVLDIRNQEDYRNGHIINAVHIPLDKLEADDERLRKLRDRPLIISCQQGRDSGRAARIIKGSRTGTTYCLKGGIQAWRSANMPLVREAEAEAKK